MIFYDGHASHLDDKALEILLRQKIQSLILKAGDYVPDQPNNNSPNMSLNNLYVNTIMKWMRHHGTLEFTPAHMNSVLVETQEVFKLLHYHPKKHPEIFQEETPPPLPPTDIGTNHQACIAGTKQSNREKADDIGHIPKASIDPTYKE